MLQFIGLRWQWGSWPGLFELRRAKSALSSKMMLHEFGVELDGSYTVSDRLITPTCILVPREQPIYFRLSKTTLRAEIDCIRFFLQHQPRSVINGTKSLKLILKSISDTTTARFCLVFRLSGRVVGNPSNQSGATLNPNTVRIPPKHELTRPRINPTALDLWKWAEKLTFLEKSAPAASSKWLF